jgi:hypothetical protein
MVAAMANADCGKALAMNQTNQNDACHHPLAMLSRLQQVIRLNRGRSRRSSGLSGHERGAINPMMPRLADFVF